MLITVLVNCICVSLTSCDVESNEEILNKLNEDYHLYDYYVDEYGNEGIVSWIYYPSSNEDKYPNGYSVVMVISCDEAYLPWGPMGESFTELDSVTSYYSLPDPEVGMTILQSMYAKGIDKYPAQEWCFNKNKSTEINGNSWRLPSFNEMRHVRGNYDSINKAILSVGGTKIGETDDKYWLCRTYSENYASTFKLNLTKEDLNENDYQFKKNYNLVRAIKYIYYYKPD